MAPCYRRIFISLVACLLVAAGPAKASFFDIFLDTWPASPPYPTATPVLALVLDDLGKGMVPLQTMSMGLSDAGVAGGAQYQTICHGSDSNPAPGDFGVSSFFDIFLESVTPTPPPGSTVSSFFDIFTEICVSGTGQPGQFVPVDYSYPSGDVRRWIDVQYFGPDSFFDVFLQVAVPEAPGFFLRYHAEYRLSDEAVAAGGLFSSTPVVALSEGIDSFFDVFCEVSLSRSLPAGTKAVTVTTTADLFTGPVGTESSTWGALKGLPR